MLESILVAIIAGGFGFLATIVSNNKNTAVMQNEIKHLAEEVQKHNNFAERIPVIVEQIKVINHRLTDLENEQK